MFDQIKEACRPKQTEEIKLYTFSKTGVPMNREQLNFAEIDTVLATSFDDCFKQRPDLATWYFVSVRKDI
jgi:hypothetical protein